MRLIDADKMKKILEIDGVKDRYSYDTLNYQPTVIKGEIAKAEYQYQRTTKIKPLIVVYEVSPRYVKYKCPVCAAIGNEHQLSKRC